jgi:hypothetical protein
VILRIFFNVKKIKTQVSPYVVKSTGVSVLALEISHARVNKFLPLGSVYEENMN